MIDSGMPPNDKTVAELGEFGLIDRLTAVFEANFEPEPEPESAFRLDLIVGNGDDAAAWEGPAGTTVFTCDAMVAGSHFDLSYSTPADVGWRSMVSAQSDIAAMGFRPAYSTVTLGLTGNETGSLLDEVYVGMAQACSGFGGRIVGGDVVRSATMFISVAMVGSESPVGHSSTLPMTRSGAKPGDLIAVTGPLGGSAGGLRLLMSGASPSGPAKALIDAHRRPEPSVATGVWLATNGVGCAVDISDGLAADLGRVCRASNATAAIQLADLPVEPELKAVFPDDWPELALGGGEGYQLLFTAPAEVVEAALAMNPAITPIGEIVAGEPQVTVLDKNGSPLTTLMSGHDHFPKR